jgi:hypothetical protein
MLYRAAEVTDKFFCGLPVALHSTAWRRGELSQSNGMICNGAVQQGTISINLTDKSS